MVKVVKINDFSGSDTTENTIGKFEKVFYKKLLKLEDINKNGYIQMEYDINNKPYLEVTSKDESTILTSNSLVVDSAKVEHLQLQNEDLYDVINELKMKIDSLEEKVEKLESSDKVVEYDINEDPNDELYLIEFSNPVVGIFGIFTLNDSKRYLFICYKIDGNISYWKKIFNY